MNKTANLVCILLTVTMLTACSYFDSGEEVDLSTAQAAPQAIDLTTGQEIKVQPLNPPIEYKDVADVVKSSTEGSVQIFPFEDEVFEAPASSGDIAVEPVSAVPVSGSGIMGAPGGYAPPLNAYPGVEVFPLDGDMATLVNPRLRTQGNNVSPSPMTPFPAPERKPDFVAVGGGPSGVPAIIFFEHDAVTIRPEDKQLLTDIARTYNANATQGDISVMGHASVQSSIIDPIQRKIINLKISMDRAFAVARALIEGGIPPERVETRGYGETRPMSGTGRSVEVASRRVEVYGVSAP